MNRTQIINELIEIYGYTEYLEIGVDNPNVNFNKVKALHKIGVDPAVKYPTVNKMTSDQFFATNKRKFDIIFIDGLHHADQVDKDIQNALNSLAEGGTIVCHDMNPTTEAMQQVPRIQGEWTGDCWIAWLKFRERSDLSMTVLDTDYGVGIIKKGFQKPIKVENPTYEGFTKHKKEWLNLVPVKLEPVSICIPAFEQYGHGKETLKQLLDSVIRLNGNFEVIVSDNSDGLLRELCSKYDVKYYVNTKRGISENTNYAISKANHELIKVMYQDDLFISTESIKKIAFALKFDHWAAISGKRIDKNGTIGKETKPFYSDSIIRGKNTIGMPSATAFRKNELTFDTKLKTLLDCEFYYQMHKKYGNPGIIKQKLVGVRYWDGSTSSKQGNLTEMEWPYVKQKHNL